MFRLLFFGLLFYLGYKVVNNLLKAPERRGEVKGEQRTKPIDLGNHDVEDADFEDIDD